MGQRRLDCRVPDPVRNLGQVVPDTAIWEALGRRDLALVKSQASLLGVPKKAKGSVNPILTFSNYNPVGAEKFPLEKKRIHHWANEMITPQLKGSLGGAAFQSPAEWLPSVT